MTAKYCHVFIILINNLIKTDLITKAYFLYVFHTYLDQRFLNFVKLFAEVSSLWFFLQRSIYNSLSTRAKII